MTKLYSPLLRCSLFLYKGGTVIISIFKYVVIADFLHLNSSNVTASFSSRKTATRNTQISPGWLLIPYHAFQTTLSRLLASFFFLVPCAFTLTRALVLPFSPHFIFYSSATSSFKDHFLKKVTILPLFD